MQPKANLWQLTLPEHPPRLNLSLMILILRTHLQGGTLGVKKLYPARATTALGTGEVLRRSERKNPTSASNSLRPTWPGRKSNVQRSCFHK